MNSVPTTTFSAVSIAVPVRAGTLRSCCALVLIKPGNPVISFAKFIKKYLLSDIAYRKEIEKFSHATAGCDQETAR